MPGLDPSPERPTFWKVLLGLPRTIWWLLTGKGDGDGGSPNHG